jgi:alginate O-acetyltransferase complex protein AlgI
MNLFSPLHQLYAHWNFPWPSFPMMPWFFKASIATTIAMLFFTLSPRYRRQILFGLSLVYLALPLGLGLLGGILLFCLCWFWALRWADGQGTEGTRRVTQWCIFLVTSFIYFGLMNLPRLGLHLPWPSVQEMGIAYLYWRVIHVTVDWRRRALSGLSPLNFFLYLFYFPTMMGGPIQRYQPFFESPFFRATEGWRPILDQALFLRILGGLVKIILCQTLLSLDYASLWEQTATLPYSMLLKILYLRAITFYLAASGANDVTLMLSLSLGIPLAENYNYPYFRRNLAQFWKNWHITLLTILRDYVYEPLGGRQRHQWLNYLLTFLFCAFWHVTSPAFLIWGLMQGLGMITLRAWQKFWKSAESLPWGGKALASVRDGLSAFPRVGYALGCLVTFHFVALSWLPFWGGHPQGTTAVLRLLGLDFLVHWLR